MYKDEENVPPIVSDALWDKANLILAKRSAAQSAEDKASYRNKYPYSGKIICGMHKQPYYRSLYRYKNGNKEVWRCQEYSKKGRCGCRSPILYTSELDDIIRQIMDEFSFQKTDIIHELLQVYITINSQSKLDKDIARVRTCMNDILHRKDKLLDLNIVGHISDYEFTLRNNRFNDEIEIQQRHLQELEEP